MPASALERLQQVQPYPGMQLAQQVPLARRPCVPHAAEALRLCCCLKSFACSGQLTGTHGHAPLFLASQRLKACGCPCVVRTHSGDAKPLLAQMLSSGGPEVEQLREVLNSGGDPSKLAEAAPALQALLQALHG